MSRRQHVIGASVLAAIGLVALLLLAIPASGSPRKYVADHYRLVARDGDSARYTSPDAAGTVVREITGRWKPYDRHNDPSGYFLRYADDIIAVTPEQTGGSSIWVDDDDRGYARWYGNVGGWWGTYSGPAENTRGGGPGSGK